MTALKQNFVRLNRRVHIRDGMYTGASDIFSSTYPDQWLMHASACLHMVNNADCLRYTRMYLHGDVRRTVIGHGNDVPRPTHVLHLVGFSAPYKKGQTGFFIT